MHLLSLICIWWHCLNIISCISFVCLCFELFQFKYFLQTQASFIQKLRICMKSNVLSFLLRRKLYIFRFVLLTRTLYGWHGNQFGFKHQTYGVQCRKRRSYMYMYSNCCFWRAVQHVFCIGSISIIFKILGNTYIKYTMMYLFISGLKTS